MTGNELHIQNAKKHKAKAATITAVLFAAVLLLCFFLTAFTIQDPPPGDQFVAVEFADIGNVEQASGQTESEVPSEVVEEVIDEPVEAQPVETVETPVVEEIVTQENSDVVIPADEEVEEVDDQPSEEEIRRQEQQERINSLFSNSDSGGGSQGSQDVGAGNEGAEDGKIEGTGVVTKNFGSGLKGGKIKTYPTITGKPKSDGSIRVKIFVDSQGNVTDAEVDYSHKETTLSDGHSIALALKSAKTAKFEYHTPIQSFQKSPGYITFYFKLE